MDLSCNLTPLSLNLADNDDTSTSGGEVYFSTPEAAALTKTAFCSFYNEQDCGFHVETEDEASTEPAIVDLDVQRGGGKRSTGHEPSKELTVVDFAPGETPTDIKNYNRLLRRSRTTEQEYAEMVNERQALALKSLRETLTSKEERRLRLLEWEISAIEDAMLGEHLDALEELVAIKERIADHLQSFVEAVKDCIPDSKTGRRRRNQK